MAIGLVIRESGEVAEIRGAHYSLLPDETRRTVLRRRPWASGTSTVVQYDAGTAPPVALSIAKALANPGRR